MPDVSNSKPKTDIGKCNKLPESWIETIGSLLSLICGHQTNDAIVTASFSTAVPNFLQTHLYTSKVLAEIIEEPIRQFFPHKEIILYVKASMKCLPSIGL